MEQAPEIVRTCYQSVKKYAGRQVVLLTENNVQNYINMPDYLNEKLKSGVLPLAIYTDLMRVALLEHYGGGGCGSDEVCITGTLWWNMD